MADIAGLLDLIRQQHYLAAGGGQKDTVDKVGSLFDTVKGGIDSYQHVIKQSLENKKAELEGVKLGQETAPVHAVETPLSPDEQAKISSGREAQLQSPATESYRAKSIEDELKKSTQPFQGYTLPESTIDEVKFAPTQQPVPQTKETKLGPAAYKTLMEAEYDKARIKALGDVVYIDPKNGDISEVAKPGYLPIQRAKSTAEATKFGRTSIMARNQLQNLLLGQQLKETAEGRTKLKEELQNLDNQSVNLKNLIDKLDKIPAGLQGGAETIASKTGYGFSDAATYDRARKAFAVSYYRAMTGDVRLSDADAADRALPLVPTAYQDEDQRKDLVDFIGNTLELRRQAVQQGIRQVDFDQIVETARKNGVNLAPISVVTKSIARSSGQGSPKGNPAGSLKPGGVLHRDAEGREAWVYPDGTYTKVVK